MSSSKSTWVPQQKPNVLTCKGCKTSAFLLNDESSGSYVCTRCAVVADGTYINNQEETRVFAAEIGDMYGSAKTHRAGIVNIPNFEHDLFASSTLSTMVGTDSGSSTAWKNKSSWQRLNVTSTQSKKLCATRKLILTMTEQLASRVSESSRHEIYELSKSMMRHREPNQDVVVAACVYIVLQKQATPLYYSDLVAAGNGRVRRQALTAACKRIAGELQRKKRRDKMNAQTRVVYKRKPRRAKPAGVVVKTKTKTKVETTTETTTETKVETTTETKVETRVETTRAKVDDKADIDATTLLAIEKHMRYYENIIQRSATCLGISFGATEAAKQVMGEVMRIGLFEGCKLSTIVGTVLYIVLTDITPSIHDERSIGDISASTAGLKDAHKVQSRSTIAATSAVGKCSVKLREYLGTRQAAEFIKTLRSDVSMRAAAVTRVMTK